MAGSRKRNPAADAARDPKVRGVVASARERADTLQPGELELLDALIARRRAALQQDALARSRRLYRGKPRKLARRIAAATISRG
jgi:hypothetical protein